MSFFKEVWAHGFDGFSQSVTASLLEVGRRDKVTRNLIVQLNKEENQLLQNLTAIAKQNPDFDETPYQLKIANIVQRRQLLTQMLECQNKSVQEVYKQIDNKISYFDHCAKSLSTNFQNVADFMERNDENKKRRKKKSKLLENTMIDVDFEEAIEAAVADPSEPLYCYCRRISFGNMIGCENPDCAIEWYHFSCVGLKEEPEKWYCPTCEKQMQEAKNSS